MHQSFKLQYQNLHTDECMLTCFVISQRYFNNLGTSTSETLQRFTFLRYEFKRFLYNVMTLKNSNNLGSELEHINTVVILAIDPALTFTK